MTPRLTGHFFFFYIRFGFLCAQFFSGNSETKNCQFSTTSLSRNSQQRLEHKQNQTEYRKKTRKPQSHVRILIYWTWAIKMNSVFSLTWPASMQIYWNKRKRLHNKRVQLPQAWFRTQTCPPFHCFGTKKYGRHVVIWKHTIYHSNARMSSWSTRKMHAH